jgi:hypothetical protein
MATSSPTISQSTRSVARDEPRRDPPTQLPVEGIVSISDVDESDRLDDIASPRAICATGRSRLAQYRALSTRCTGRRTRTGAGRRRRRMPVPRPGSIRSRARSVLLRAHGPGAYRLLVGIRALGYTGSANLLVRYLNQLHAHDQRTAPPLRRLVGWIMNRSADLPEHDRSRVCQKIGSGAEEVVPVGQLSRIR